MKIYKSLRHTIWECRYHVVLIPEWPRKRSMTGSAGICLCLCHDLGVNSASFIYADVYPLTMILSILCAQLHVLLLGR